MNKRILMGALLLATLMLSACAVPPPKLDPFTDQEISSMDDVSFCNAFHSFALVGILHNARMYREEGKRRISCEFFSTSFSCTKQGFKSGSKEFTSCLDLERKKRDPAFSRCYDKGFKINTKSMASCIDLENMKIADPAFNYCYDKGFKTGTQPMATCLASW